VTRGFQQLVSLVGVYELRAVRRDHSWRPDSRIEGGFLLDDDDDDEDGYHWQVAQLKLLGKITSESHGLRFS
jgi:hypothetical protein